MKSFPPSRDAYIDDAMHWYNSTDQVSNAELVEHPSPQGGGFRV